MHRTFYTTKARDRLGTGVGSTVYQGKRWRLEVESGVGRYLYDPEISEAKTMRRRILIIDDEESTCKLLSLAASGLRYR